MGMEAASTMGRVSWDRGTPWLMPPPNSVAVVAVLRDFDRIGCGGMTANKLADTGYNQ